MSSKETQHFCIFCLTTSTDTGGKIPLKFVEEAFFKSLEIYFRSGFQSSRNACQFQTCKECERIINLYCTLFRHMQNVEEKIQKTIQFLGKLMKDAGTSPLTINQYGSSFINGFRDEVMKKCSSKRIPASGPRIIFQQLRNFSTTFRISAKESGSVIVDPLLLQKFTSLVAIVLLNFEFFKPTSSVSAEVPTQPVSTRARNDKILKRKNSTPVHTSRYSPPVPSPITAESGATEELPRKLLFKCDYHKKYFQDAMDLLEHYQLYHPDASIYQCSTCDWPFLDEYEKEVHELDHTQASNAQNRCPRCGQYFSGILSLQSHYFQSHSKYVVLRRCSKCFKHFEGYSELKKHLKSYHKEDNPRLQKWTDPSGAGEEAEMVELGDADEGEWNELEVGAEEEVVTEQEPPEVDLTEDYSETEENDSCEQDDLAPTIVSTQSIVAPPPINPTRTFPCFYCFRTAKSKISRKNHITRCPGRKRSQGFMCDKDNHKFPGPEGLLEHFGQHHQDDPVYTCNVCQWPFLDEDILELHQLLHTIPVNGANASQKRFACKKCGLIFPSIEYLESHFNTEHGKKLPIHKCPRCFKGFSANFRLRNHLKYDHKEGVRGQVAAPAVSRSKNKLVLIKKKGQAPQKFVIVFPPQPGTSAGNPLQSQSIVPISSQANTTMEMPLYAETEILPGTEQYLPVNTSSAELHGDGIAATYSYYEEPQENGLQFEDPISNEFVEAVGIGEDDMEIGDVKVVRSAN